MTQKSVSFSTKLFGQAQIALNQHADSLITQQLTRLMLTV